MSHNVTWKSFIGTQFGRLTILDRAPNRQNSKAVRVRCACSCGKEVVVHLANLKRGTTASCGCYCRDQTSLANQTHGLTCGRKKRKLPRSYNIWSGMKDRCLNPKSPQYSFYGGRGIAVCSRWMSFENFYADMGDPPEGLSLDRIDNNGSYCKENCRWATRKVQNNNRSNTVFIEHRGERRCLSEWSQVTGLKSGTIWYRLHQGWSTEDVLSLETPHSPQSRG